jgi:hypothetical protein
MTDAPNQQIDSPYEDAIARQRHEVVKRMLANPPQPRPKPKKHKVRKAS